MATPRCSPKTPFHDQLYAKYPRATLSASGMDVGLPPGQMGNSEVGHLNLGAGRIVYQDLTRINKAIKDGELAKNPVLQEALRKPKGIGCTCWACFPMAAFTAISIISSRWRTRRRKPASGTSWSTRSPMGATPRPPAARRIWRRRRGNSPRAAPSIATVIGRYYAMDRDKRWERNKLAWDAIVLGRGEVPGTTPAEAVKARYAAGETDEFLKPMVFSHVNEQRVRDGDVVLFFNFRADRARQFSLAFLRPDFNGFDREVTPEDPLRDAHRV